LLAFVRAVVAAFPPGASRDRFGRINCPRDLDQLRELAVKYEIGSCDYVDERVGKVASAILAKPIFDSAIC